MVTLLQFWIYRICRKTELTLTLICRIYRMPDVTLKPLICPIYRILEPHPKLEFKAQTLSYF